MPQVTAVRLPGGGGPRHGWVTRYRCWHRARLSRRGRRSHRRGRSTPVELPRPAAAARSFASAHVRTRTPWRRCAPPSWPTQAPRRAGEQRPGRSLREAETPRAPHRVASSSSTSPRRCRACGPRTKSCGAGRGRLHHQHRQRWRRERPSPGNRCQAPPEGRPVGRDAEPGHGEWGPRGARQRHHRRLRCTETPPSTTAARQVIARIGAMFPLRRLAESARHRRCLPLPLSRAPRWPPTSSRRAAGCTRRGEPPLSSSAKAGAPYAQAVAMKCTISRGCGRERGAGQGIALALGAAGMTVYVTGCSTTRSLGRLEDVPLPGTIRGDGCGNHVVGPASQLARSPRTMRPRGPGTRGRGVRHARHPGRQCRQHSRRVDRLLRVLGEAARTRTSSTSGRRARRMWQLLPPRR